MEYTVEQKLWCVIWFEMSGSSTTAQRQDLNKRNARFFNRQFRQNHEHDVNNKPKTKGAQDQGSDGQISRESAHQSDITEPRLNCATLYLNVATFHFSILIFPQNCFEIQYKINFQKTSFGILDAKIVAE